MSQDESDTLHPQSPRRRTLVVLCALGAFLLLGVGATLSIRHTTRKLSRDEVLAKRSRPTTVQFPFVCEVNRKQEIFNQTFEGTGTVIVAQYNCELKIRDCRLKGDVVVLAKNASRLEIINSTLEGTDVAIRTERVASLHLTGRTVLRGRNAAVDAGNITNLELADGRAEGGLVGIRTGSNVKLWLRRSTVIGERYAVEAGHNLELSTSRVTLRGERAALWAAGNLALDAQGGLFSSQDSAVVAPEPNSIIKLSHNLRLEAKSTGIESGDNLKLDVESASIDADGVGVRAGANAGITLRSKTRIRGGRTGLRLTSSLDIGMQDAVIESDGHGICATRNAAVSVRNSAIRTNGDGLRLWSSPRRFEVDALETLGKRNFEAKDCEP